VLAAEKVASKDVPGRLLGLPSRAAQHHGLRDNATPGEGENGRR
jgi:hypothetical protein